LATPTEALLKVRQLLSNPPGREGSGLSPVQYGQFVENIRQLVEFCLNNPREDSGLINRLVREALHSNKDFGPDWNLDLPISDRARAAVDRRYTIGHVKIDGPSALMGFWQIRHAITEERQAIFFSIVCENFHLETASYTGPEERRQQIVQRLLERGPAPWRLQIPNDCPLADWAIAIAGSRRIGCIKGFDSLGPFGEYVIDYCLRQGIDHILMPYLRRDPQTEDWHIGPFLALRGDSFCWNDWALQRGNLIRAKVTMGLKCTLVKK
jgi:hypothetical protein